MIANENNPLWIDEATPEEKARLERSSAPTLRDLRVAAEDLMASIAAEPDSTSPNDSHPR